VLGAPSVEAIEFRQCAVAEFPPLPETFNNGGQERRSRFKNGEMSFKFLKSQGRGDISASAFAFDYVARGFRQTTVRALVVTLVSAEKSTTSNSAKARRVFDEPTLPAERKLTHHGVFASVPIDRRDKSRGETMSSMPVGIGAFGESNKSIQLLLVNLRQLFCSQSIKTIFQI
jgi:hypothetical protein